jgi:hypothetical protein
MSNHRAAQAIGRQGQTQAGIKVLHICGTPSDRNWVTFRGRARTDWPLECQSVIQGRDRLNEKRIRRTSRIVT